MEHLNSVLWAAEPLPACSAPSPSQFPGGRDASGTAVPARSRSEALSWGVPLSAQLGSLSLHPPYSEGKTPEVEQTR